MDVDARSRPQAAKGDDVAGAGAARERHVGDRDQGVGRKIRDAEKEWVPLTVVYGDKEAASQMLPVRMRGGEQKDLKLSELEDHARHLQGGRPTAPLPVPVRVSLRPVFHG